MPYSICFHGPPHALRCFPARAREQESDLGAIIFRFGVSASPICKWAQKLQQLRFPIRTKHERCISKPGVCKGKAAARQFWLKDASELQMSEVSYLVQAVRLWWARSYLSTKWASQEWAGNKVEHLAPLMDGLCCARIWLHGAVAFQLCLLTSVLLSRVTTRAFITQLYEQWRFITLHLNLV